MPITTRTVTDEIASAIARTIADTYGSTETPHVFPGSHEGLGKDVRVITWEGGDAPYDWPVHFPTHFAGQRAAREHDVWFEAVHGCAIAVFPGSPERGVWD